MSHYTALKALINLKQEQSLTATAQSLGVAKSTLSRRLAVLEEELGYRLTQQSKGRLLLTSAGKCYADYAKIILQTALEAKQALAALSKEMQGLLTVQLCPELTRGWATSVLNSFLKQYPAVQLDIATFYSDYKLTAGKPKADLYISCKSMALENYRHHYLGQWQLGIYQAANQSRPIESRLDQLEDLQALNWIMHKCDKHISLSNPTSKEIKNIKVSSRFKVDSLAMKAEAIAKGYGVGVLPNWMAECPRNGFHGSFEKIRTCWKVEPIKLMLYYKKHTTPATEALIQHLEKNLPPRWRLLANQ